MQDALRTGSEDREELARWRAALVASGDILYDWDLVTDSLRWSDGVEHLLGIAGLEAGYRGELFDRRINPEDIPARRLALCWGIHTVLTEDASSIDEMFSRAGEIACREGFTKPGDRILISAGVPIGTPGTTNMLRVATVGRDGKGV